MKSHAFNWKRFRILPLLLSLVAAVVAWHIVTPSPISAQQAKANAKTEGNTGGKTKINPKDGSTYIWIPPGSFQMGCLSDQAGCSGDEKPAHSVTITKGFWIGQTLVTQATYKKVMTANPNIYRADQISEPVEMAGLNPSIFKGDQLPVEDMTWNDARAYCEGVGMRLPTEAEWEYAARGGTATPTYARLDQIAWYQGNSNGSTHDVAQKQPNAYGLYDMVGDVWEWTSDWYGRYDVEPVTDPKGPVHGTYRVLRGGSWYTGSDPSELTPTSTIDFSVSTRSKGEEWVGAGNFGGDRGVRCAGD